MHQHREALEQTAREMVAAGKGILAADESNGTMAKRLASVGVEPNEGARRRFRELLLTTPGVDEQIAARDPLRRDAAQATSKGTRFPELLADRGIIAGIKVDTGAKPLAGFEGETVTEGLDGLRARLADYRELGASFAKWRAVIAVSDELPTRTCIAANAHALARYAALCQEAGHRPDRRARGPDGRRPHDRPLGGGHRATLEIVFDELAEHGSQLEGIVLKPNMILSGDQCSRQASIGEVAERTLALLSEIVPAAVPGIAFLSGGQSDALATAHLSAMNEIGGVPWELTFSYGRALQSAPLRAWGGREENLAAAQAAFAHRARCNAEARRGRYSEDLELAANRCRPM